MARRLGHSHPGSLSTHVAAQVAGADLAHVGSAFLSTHEANVVEDYKHLVERLRQEYDEAVAAPVCGREPVTV